jgi:hypothetical protein
MPHGLVNIYQHKIRNRKVIKGLIAAAAVFSLVGVFSTGRINQYLASLNNFDSANAASDAALAFGQVADLKVGDEFSLPVKLTTNGNIAGVDLKIQFENSKLRLNDISLPQNSLLKTFLPQDNQSNPTKASVIESANASGLIKYSLLAYDQVSGKVNSTGVLNAVEISSLSFVALNSGKSLVSFLYTTNQTTDTNVSDLNQPRDILQSTQGLELNINSLVASTSPSIVASAIPSASPIVSRAPSPSPSRLASPSPLRSASATRSPSPTPATSIAATPSQVPSSSPESEGNHGLRFDGINDVVTSTQKLPYLSSFTAEVILSPLRKNATGLILVAGDDNNGWSLEMLRGRAIFWMADRQGTWSRLTHPRVMPLNSWNHIAVTYDNGQTKIYVNGALENASKRLSAEYNPAPIFQIGGLQKYPHFNGLIDSVRISKGNLYAQNTFNAPTFMSPSSDQTLVLYQFNEATGQTIKNSALPEEYKAVLGITDKAEGVDPTWIKIQR